jgi:hypothetical protein
MNGAHPLQEESMKLVSRVLAVLAAVALATPAFACGDKTTTKSAEAKPATAQSQKVAKSESKTEKKSAASHPKQQPEAKPATASN